MKSSNKLPKIFIYWTPDTTEYFKKLGHALAEDGTILRRNDAENSIQPRIELMSLRTLRSFETHYPSGYELVWIDYDDLKTNQDFKRAFEIAQGKCNSGVELIAIERDRQISLKGLSPMDDDLCLTGELAEAAIAYAFPDRLREFDEDNTPSIWPFSEESWKPSPTNRIRELVKAAALLAAEIDRLRRQEYREKHGLNLSDLL